MIQGELTTLRPATAADTERVEGLANGDAEAQALVVEEGGTPVGWVRYRRADRARQGGVDIELVPSARDRGLGSDAVEALVQHLMTDEGWRRVTASPAATDLRGVGFWFRNGFRPAGVMQTPDGPRMLMVRRRVHPWMHSLRDRKERHKARSRVYRITVAVVAVLVILIGLALVPLPGPGWLIVAVGVFLLALEFDRAEKLLERILEKLEDVSDQAQKAGPWAKAGLAVLAVAGTIAAALAFVLWDVPFLPG